jgi:hypothetical protein
MLSKKQLWRKAARSLVHPDDRNALCSVRVPRSARHPSMNSLSDESTSSEKSEVHSASDSYFSSPPGSPKSVFSGLAQVSPHNGSRNLFDDNPWSEPVIIMKCPKPKKSVTFCQSVKVRLIPTRNEMAFLHDDLYWNRNECASAARESMEEIESFVRNHPCSFRVAATVLYQPEYDDHLQAIEATKDTQSQKSMECDGDHPSLDFGPPGGLWIVFHSH